MRAWDQVAGEFALVGGRGVWRDYSRNAEYPCFPSLERLFRELACAKCHVPTFRTSAKPFRRLGDPTPVTFTVLLDREVAPYSDFLLHDLGPTLNDGVALGVAKPGEYRTPPLWGVRFRMHQLLHDARANNLEQAIIYHGGEAATSRNRFLSLPAEDRQALIEFLKTL